MAEPTKHNYGRAIRFFWEPIADDQSVAPYELVSARLYGPNVEPTLAQRQNTASGHVNEKTTWTPVGPKQFEILFDAQTDSDPGSNKRYDSYYAVVNFRYAAGGPIVFDEEILYVWRPDSLTSAIRISPEDVYKLEPRIRKVSRTNIDVEELIAAAIEDLFEQIKAKGYRKHRLFNLQDFQPCARRMATSYVCNGLANDNNPKWGEKAEFWADKAETMFNTVSIGYDIDDDDKPDPEEKTFTGAVAVLR